MKALPFCLLLLFSCADPEKIDTNTTEPGTVTSMKGFEIYAFEKDGKIFYTLLPGTNRNKRMDEIYSEDNAVEGIDSIKMKVKDIAAGEYVMLRPIGIDSTRLEELKAYLQKKELQVSTMRQTGF